MAGCLKDGGAGAGFMTFEMVEERLIEAMRLWWRSPDRERGWLSVKAYWPDIFRHHHFGDYADHEAVPRPEPLTRAQIGEMEEAGDWMRHVPERDRKLVAMALACLARGDKRVPWRRLLRPMGLQLGADGLRKRYGSAITAIAKALNAAENRQGDGQEGKSAV